MSISATLRRNFGSKKTCDRKKAPPGAFPSLGELMRGNAQLGGE